MQRILCFIVLLTSGFALVAADKTVIEHRQNTFQLIETELEEAEDLLDGAETPWGALDPIALKLLLAGRELKQSFPPGSDAGSSASHQIWKNPEPFQALLDEMGQGFSLLHQAVKQQNVRLAEQGIEQAEATCRRCHRSYRSFW
ncbi:cytochrome c [Photobacterium sp. R1]